MKYLHSMVRVRDLDASLRFYCDGLGLKEVRRMENAAGKYTLVFLAADETPDAEIELTYNWDPEPEYGSSRNFGHLAFRVADIYATCARLLAMGEQEVPSEKIGELVMKELKKLDKVAYIRFASVYRNFADVDEFSEVIREVQAGPRRSKTGKPDPDSEHDLFGC